MKKEILLTLLVCVFGFFSADAQCTTDPTLPATGQPFAPSFGTSLPAGEVGVPYNTNIAMYLADTLPFEIPLVGTVSLPVQSVTYTITAPAGLSGVCDPVTRRLLAGESGCFSISGTPTSAGAGTVSAAAAFTVLIDSATSAASFGTLPEGPFTLPGGIVPPFTWDMSTASGVADELHADAFELGQNVPNPAGNLTTIFFTTPNPSSLGFKVFDLLGNVVEKQSISAVKGLNSVELSTAGYAPGIYIYTLSNTSATLTKRMVVVR